MHSPWNDWRRPIARQRSILIAVAVSAILTGPAAADLYHISVYEKAACTPDAMRFCSYAYPDERQLLGCMKANESALSATCRVAFNSGIKRRHLQ